MYLKEKTSVAEGENKLSRLSWVSIRDGKKRIGKPVLPFASLRGEIEQLRAENARLRATVQFLEELFFLKE